MARFGELLLGPLDAPRKRTEFWDELLARQDPRMEGHTILSRRNWKSCTAPFSFHADAVPVVQVGKAGSKRLACDSMQSY